MEDIYLQTLKQTTGLEWVAEYKFHPTRRWRIDYACLSHKIAIEVNGGNFVFGRHSNPIQLAKEYEKRANAAALGWVMVECTPVTNKLDTMRFGTEMFWGILSSIIKLREK